MAFKSVKYERGSQLVISSLFEKAGGLSRIAKACKSQRQVALNWRNRGSVPLKWCGILSRLLKVSPFAFNYEDCALYAGKAPEWREVVNDLGLPTQVVGRVLNLKPPVNPLRPTVVSKVLKKVAKK